MQQRNIILVFSGSFNPIHTGHIAVLTTIKDELEKSQIIKAKKFIGFEINSLYSFFMVFVVMAGVASIILFVQRELHTPDRLPV